MITEEVSETSKYASLLKPIKELAQNWNIDIAGELVEYLDVLDNIEICFDETGESKLNFAEAALLIQGSTMVYSKKVEFLYNLVYQTLDLLCDDANDSTNNGNRVRRRRTAIDDEEKYESDKQKFLLLDDVVPLANAKTSISLKLPTTLKDKKKYMSQALKQPFPHALMAGRSDIGLAESSQSLKLMTCGVYNGAVILDDTFLKKSRFKIKFKSSSVPELKTNTEQDPTEENGNGEEDYDDYHEEGFGFEDGGIDDGCSVIESDEQGAAGMALASPVNRNPIKDIDEESEDEDNHFYDRLDPHDASQLPSRPFKRGKTWLLPKRLDEKKVAKEESELDDLEETKENSFVSMAKPTNPNPKRSLIYPEFAYFMNFQRKLQRQMKQMINDIQDSNHNDYIENDEDYNEINNNLEPYEDDDDDFGGGVYDDDLDDDNDNGNGELGRRLSFDANSLAGNGVDEDSYVSLVRKKLNDYLNHCQEWALESGMEKKVRNWKEKISKKLAVKRDAFDIKVYMQRVEPDIEVEQEHSDTNPDEDLEDKHNHNHTISVEAILAKRCTEDYEVPRYFAAMLQLAANKNLILS